MGGLRILAAVQIDGLGGSKLKKKKKILCITARHDTMMNIPVRVTMSSVSVN